MTQETDAPPRPTKDSEKSPVHPHPKKPGHPHAADDIGEKTPFMLGWVGRLLAPVLALLVFVLLPSGTEALSDQARITAAVGTLMAVLWMTEAMPLPATALLPLALLPLAGVVTLREAAAPYAHEFIFLFMGGFMLALSMQRWGLHRRIALVTVLAIGSEPRRLVAGFMVATGFLSMWISNTATAVMMLPIGVSVITLLKDKLSEHEDPGMTRGVNNFAICLMLAIAYGANFGGLGTLIGSPPNLFLASFMKEAYGVDIAFGKWMLIGLPLSIILISSAWYILAFVVFPVKALKIPGGDKIFKDELEKLGRISRGETIVLTIFLCTALAWILREPMASWTWLATTVPAVTQLTDSSIAIIAALLLFSVPVNAKRSIFVLDWPTAVKLPWGILLLFGGGLSLAASIQASGLDKWIGLQFAALGGIPTIALVVIVTAAVILLTNVTSNTAVAAAFLPILGGIAVGIQADPLLLALPTAIAASCALIMPVGTPPNAIVFGSGYLTVGHMVKGGAYLTLLCIIVIPIVVLLLGPIALGLDINGTAAAGAFAR